MQIRVRALLNEYLINKTNVHVNYLFPCVRLPSLTLEQYCKKTQSDADWVALYLTFSDIMQVQICNEERVCATRLSLVMSKPRDGVGAFKTMRCDIWHRVFYA